MKSSSAVSLLRNVTVSWAKCSTAMRIRWAIAASAQAEPDAGSGKPAGNGNRRAVGTPAGRARQRAVLVELDRVHAARHRCHLDDLVPHRRKLGADPLRYGLLDLERIALDPDPGRLDRLLQAHAVVDQVDQRLHRAREDALAAGQSQR